MSPALMGSLFITGKSKAFSYVLEVLLFFSGINSSFLSHFSLELKTFLFVLYQKKKKKRETLKRNSELGFIQTTVNKNP